MAYREVTMVEVREVLRLWLGEMGKRRIAARLGLDPKTVRGYIGAARERGLERPAGATALTDELVGQVLAARRGTAHRPHGDTWSRCAEQREFIERHLRNRVRLSKIRKLLRRQGVQIPYATLRRWAVATLGFGRTAPTLPVADGKPGEECQLDTGWVLTLEPDTRGKRRRVKAWIVTAVVSRHRFVYPIEHETTASAIEACEAAWEFFGGIFLVLLPDNTKAIVQRADPLEPLINPVFLEYSQARGFQIDTARVRKPKDKARVERSVPTVRDDCFGGERLCSIEAARTHARWWCADDYGLSRHSTTQRLPREHFETEERPHLLPAPTAPYDVPLQAEPKVARDQHALVAKALYSLPTAFVGQRLWARADRATVRFYDRGVLVKVHPRRPPGQRSTDPADFPEHKRVYALRDVHYLQSQASACGPAGRFAAQVLAVPLPWTRMRRVYALLGLVRKYGPARVEAACTTALAAEMLSVPRLKKMLAHAASAPAVVAPAQVAPARYLRSPQQYALRLVSARTMEVGHGQ
jgi:transposase